MFIKKRGFVRLITYFTAAVIALGAYAFTQNTVGAGYRRTAEYGYSRAFSELVRSVDKLDDALLRGRFTTGSELSASVCADIRSGCQSAAMTMAVLPFSTQELEKTAAFINLADDYAGYLLKTCPEGFGDTERENLGQLASVSGGLKKALTELSDRLDAGEVLMDAPENVFSDENAAYLSAAMLKLEGELGELPTFEYNSVYPKAAEAIERTVTEDEAKKAAEEFFGFPLEHTDYNSDSVFCFAFDGGTVTVDGAGRVLSLSSSGSVTGDMESSELEQLGADFLTEHGFSDMLLRSSDRRDSVQTLGYACSSDGIVCENDCIRVSFSAADGSVYAFDATQYYRCHTDRDIPAAAVTQEQALSALPAGLVSQGSETVLCADNNLERLCYAFDCVSDDGESVRVFVDASTGKMFKISLDSQRNQY